MVVETKIKTEGKSKEKGRRQRSRGREKRGKDRDKDRGTIGGAQINRTNLSSLPALPPPPCSGHGPPGVRVTHMNKLFYSEDIRMAILGTIYLHIYIHIFIYIYVYIYPSYMSDHTYPSIYLSINLSIYISRRGESIKPPHLINHLHIDLHFREIRWTPVFFHLSLELVSTRLIGIYMYILSCEFKN